MSCKTAANLTHFGGIVSVRIDPPLLLFHFFILSFSGRQRQTRSSSEIRTKNCNTRNSRAWLRWFNTQATYSTAKKRTQPPHARFNSAHFPPSYRKSARTASASPWRQGSTACLVRKPIAAQAKPKSTTTNAFNRNEVFRCRSNACMPGTKKTGRKQAKENKVALFRKMLRDRGLTRFYTKTSILRPKKAALTRPTMRVFVSALLRSNRLTHKP